jgi:hypothetical protein
LKENLEVEHLFLWGFCEENLEGVFLAGNPEGWVE